MNLEMAVHELISAYKFCKYRQHGIYTSYVIILKILALMQRKQQAKAH